MPETLQPTPEAVRKAGKLSDHWRQLRHEVEPEKKDKIGSLYMEHILGLDEEVIESFTGSISQFVNGEQETYHLVGVAQSGFKPEPENIRKFWTQVREVEPKLIPTEDELEFVVENDDGAGLIWELVGSTIKPSLLLSKLRANAHAYK